MLGAMRVPDSQAKKKKIVAIASKYAGRGVKRSPRIPDLNFMTAMPTRRTLRAYSDSLR
jgi:hypothetical protein